MSPAPWGYACAGWFKYRRKDREAEAAEDSAEALAEEVEEV